ncbi:TonB-dependent receptor [Novosphingobium sp. Leaf2]|uniref:TonB-dependent receptor n=1 Tax=Novosphingobium sp. Leaf2 TaxID=1735670 RepID=UPI0007019DA2|nr:TonB-dependent receptor [Novosphingobium sp. Leaf2]KQM20803.1 TonB-dependent receptor [Novosphingobium sp. Leaf2]
MRGVFALAGSGLAIIMAQSPAFAQSASTDAAAPRNNEASATQDQAGIQDIVVTAQRTSTTVQRTPATIEVLNPTDLVARGVGSLNDALSNVSGVYIQSNNKGLNVNIRGVGTGLDSAAGDPGVNTNIDGVYYRQASTIASGLYDLDRIEVLKGPQGTLYGRNATGGAVNVLTADPTFDFGYRAAITVGNYSLLRTDAAINVPLSSTLAVRAAFGSESRDGYYDTGQDDADRKGGRLKVLWTPSSSLRLLAGVSYSHDGGVGPGTISVSEPEGSRHAVVNHLPAGQLDAKLLTVFGNLEWDAGPVRVTFIPTYSHYLYDYIGTNTSFYSQQRAREKQFSSELRFSSPVGSPISWVAGLYYYNDDLANYSNLLDLGVINDQPNLKTRSYAAFSDVTAKVTDSFRIIGGVRYTKDNKKQIGTTVVGGGVTVGPFDGVLKSNAVNFRLGAQLDLTPTVMAYATYATGYKAGGFVPDEPGYNTFKPERLRSLEGGIKSRLFGNSLQLNAAGFYYNYDNYQVSSLGFAHYGGLSALVFNSQGKTKIYGLEFQASYQATSDDQIGLTLSLMHSEFGTFIIPATPVTPATDVSGKKLPSAPSLSGSAFYQHDWHIGEGKITARADTYFSTSYWSEFSHAPNSQRPGYTRTDLSVTYYGDNGLWSVGAFVKNIENSWVVSLKANTAVGDYFLQPPRTFGATLTLKN